MIDQAGLELLVSGHPAGAAHAGLRLLRRLDCPSELSVRWTLDAAEGAVPAEIGARMTLRIRGGPVLFDGDIVRMTREAGPDGAFCDMMAEDDLGRLRRRRTPSAGDMINVRSWARTVAHDLGYDLRSSGPDVDTGRHLHHVDTDLDHLTNALARLGFGLSLRPDVLDLIDLTEEPAAPKEAPVAFRHRRVTEPDLAEAGDGWSGWRSDTDRPMRAGSGTRGPAGRPLRAEEAVSRLQMAGAATAQASADWIEAEATGLHDLWPGDGLRLPGGVFRLTWATLLLDAAHGPRTLYGSAPRPKKPAPASEILTATVREIADPQRAGRVKVSLTGRDGLSTGWLPVAGVLGQGGHGLALPLKPGDPVVLAAPSGDPELGIVLGGLARAGRGPGARLREGATTGLCLSTKDAALSMGDTAGGITLAMGDGTQIELNDGTLSLTAPRRLDIFSDGPVSIRGSRIDFDRA